MQGNQQINILFMDDEIQSQEAVIVHEAISGLKEAGYSVVLCETMEHALIEFRKAPLKSIFVLDIDMNSDLGRGSGVAGRYRSLDNQCKVIMFSARGDVEDWFEVANRHVFGYVDKNGDEPVNTLLGLVEEAVESLNAGLALPNSKRSGEILIVSDLECPAFPFATQEDAVRSAGFLPIGCKLSAMAEMLEQKEFVASLLFTQSFSTRPKAFKPIREICQRQPYPQTIIATEGIKSNRGFILDCINVRPFRLIDLTKENLVDRLQEAIQDASIWYGGNEVFVAEENDLHLMIADMEPIELSESEYFTDNDQYEDDSPDDHEGLKNE